MLDTVQDAQWLFKLEGQLSRAETPNNRRELNTVGQADGSPEA